MKQITQQFKKKKEMAEENEKKLTKKIYESKIYLKHCKMTQKVFKAIIKKAKKSVHDKDKVFVNLYEKHDEKKFS